MFISKEKYKACIYTRLSKDDGDKPESDSIGNQKALIRDFIKNHPEIEVVSEKAVWSWSSVSRILTNEIYTGVLVQGKVSTPNYKVKKFMEKDESEWIRVEQSHEAIIDEDTFRVTQELLKKDVRRGPERGRVYPLSGYLVCADCGQNMIRKSAVSGGKKYFYYVCSGHKARNDCKPHSIREEELFDGVLTAMQGHVKVVADAKKKIGKKKAAAEKNSAGTVKKLADLQKKKSKCESDRFTNMDQFMAGNLDKESYQKRRAELTKEVERLDGLIADLEAKFREMETVQDEGTKALMETAERFSGAKELDQKMVDALIEKVLVYDPEHVEICWKFSDEAMKLLKE